MNKTQGLRFYLQLAGVMTLGAGWYAVMHAVLPSPAADVAGLLGALLCAVVGTFVLLQQSGPSDLSLLAFDALEDEVWIFDADTTQLSYMNAAAVARSELDPTAMLGQPLNTVGAQAAQAGLFAERAKLQTGQIIVLDQRSFRPHVTLLEGGQLEMVVLRDVTCALADEKNKADFISTVSHELRSPMTSIKGAIGLLLANSAGALPDPARGMLEIAHRNAARLMVILNDILDLQKIAEGDMAFDVNDTDASALVHEAIAASALFVRRFDLKIDVAGAGERIAIRTDPNRVIQVLTNLLTNAAKFSKPHGTILITLAQSSEGVTISVQDQGEGIPADQQDRVFERFADLTNSDRQKKGGSGLGLSICKAIVEKLGGSISFESAEGAGTTFCFTIPHHTVALPQGTMTSDRRVVG